MHESALVNMAPVTLSTERLVLRPCEGTDAEEVCIAREESLDDLRPWFWWCHPVHDTARCAEWVSSRPDAWARGEEFAFVVRSHVDGQVIGCVWIGSIDRNSLRGSVGYWIRSSMAGRGYAGEAVRSVVEFGLVKAGLLRIEIVTSTENKGSCRVAEKAGGVLEGIARRRLLVGGVSQDACIYSVLREDL